MAAAVEREPELKRPRLCSGGALLRGLANCDPFGVVAAVEDAKRAEHELERARAELRDAVTKGKLLKLCSDWDEALATQDDYELGLRSTCMPLDADAFDAHFDWAGWSARDEVRLSSECDAVKKAEMVLQREVVTRLAGEISLRQEWLGPLQWMDEARCCWEGDRTMGGGLGARMVDVSLVAERQRHLFAEVIWDYYRHRQIHIISTEVIDRRGRLEVFMHLRVHRSAFQAFVPRLLRNSFGDSECFYARVASGLRPAAVVAFSGHFVCVGDRPSATSSKELAALICSFVPTPEDAVQTIRALATERRRQSAIIRGEAMRISIDLSAGSGSCSV